MRLIAIAGAIWAALAMALAANGVARAPHFYARLHYLSLASLLPLAGFMVAVAFAPPEHTVARIKLGLLLALVIASGPLTVHVLAHAHRAREGRNR